MDMDLGSSSTDCTSRKMMKDDSDDDGPESVHSHASVVSSGLISSKMGRVIHPRALFKMLPFAFLLLFVTTIHTTYTKTRKNRHQQQGDSIMSTMGGRDHDARRLHRKDHDPRRFLTLPETTGKIIIFLDMDGVLAPWPPSEDGEAEDDDGLSKHCHNLIPDDTLMAFAELLEEIPRDNLLIVLSSCWRMHKHCMKKATERFLEFSE